MELGGLETKTRRDWIESVIRWLAANAALRSAAHTVVE